MSLKQRIDADLKTAMKARDEAARSATRLLKAEITRREIEVGQELDDAEVLRLIEKQLKMRREAAALFRDGGRPELAEKEEREGAFLQTYLPQPLTPEELERLVDAAIAQAGAKSPKEMGQVMKLALAQAQGRADGKAVSELVKKKLSTSA